MKRIFCIVVAGLLHSLAFTQVVKVDAIGIRQTVLVVKNIGNLYRQMLSENYKIVSGQLVVLGTTGGQNGKAFIVRDNDGHAMLCMEELQ